MESPSETTALLWLLLEAAVAGVLFALLIWWTLWPARKRDHAAGKAPSSEPRDPGG